MFEIVYKAPTKKKKWNWCFTSVGPISLSLKAQTKVKLNAKDNDGSTPYWFAIMGKNMLSKKRQL